MTSTRPPAFDPDVVAPYWLGEGDRGVLLLHGFAGTPPELRHLGEELAKRGITAYAPLLAGHGTTPEDLERTGHRAWEHSAAAGLDQLLSRCRRVGVAGQSAGANLALLLAARRPEIRAIVAQAAFVRLDDWRIPLLPALRHLVRWQVPEGRVDLYDSAAMAQLHSYSRRPTKSIYELHLLCRELRRELPAVVQPLLLLQGERDRVVNPANADRIIARVSSEERALLRYPRSGHGLSVDVDWQAAAAAGASWFEAHL